MMMVMDREQLAGFLRSRREALRPEDVGLSRGPRRRTAGLRREEVAALSNMSTDYYARLEQQRGPRPSPAMLSALARGLRLSFAERDHLFLLAGHAAPSRAWRGDHVSPGMMRILDRLHDTPAEVVTALGETLVQTRMARALFGDNTRFSGLDSSVVYRWFTLPDGRDRYPVEDHPAQSQVFAAHLRAAYTAPATRSRAAEVVHALTERSEEFVELWKQHSVHVPSEQHKRILHPELGLLDVHCQILVDPDQQHSLLVYTATPGSTSYEQLQLLSVIADQNIGAEPAPRRGGPDSV
jgi:transcriptional regulator with XRE-family HTH domain